MKQILLDKSDFSTALYCGALRSMESILHGREDSVYNKSWLDGTRDHILGACGEIAVAKFLGVYSSLSINEFGKPDIHVNNVSIEVRHRASTDHDLIVRRRDNPSSVFVLTRGMPPSIQIVGWNIGREIMIDKYLNNHGGYGQAWFVPPSALLEMEDLVVHVEKSLC